MPIDPAILCAVRPQWEVLPLLRSCKLLAKIATRELYKDIIILHPIYLHRLLIQAHSDSFHSIETLDITHAADDEDVCDLEDEIDDRIFQSKGFAFAQHWEKVGWDSSLSTARALKQRWDSDFRPQLKMLKGSAADENVIHGLLRL